MWWFLVLVFCNQVLSQPVTDELSRKPRELIECCPCPSHGSEDTLGRSSQIGRESVDDCPCRARSADSEGASSILFPSSIRLDGPHIRPFNTKEEQKNLLEPEVGLATSMLETLREATEEEYRDALARDAARSATGPDGTAEESAKNLVIIVNPRSSEDDALGEASHVEESRCAHPLSSAPLGRMRSTPSELNLLPDILKLPRLRRPGLPHRNLLDMDSSLGASNVEEKVIDLNGIAPVTKSKPTFLFRSNVPFKSKLFANNNEENLNEDVPVSKPSTSVLRSNIPFKSKLFEKAESDPKSLPTLKSPLLSKSKIKPLFDGLRLPLVPKMRDSSSLQKANDLNPAPSIVQEDLDDSDEKLSNLPGFAKRPTLMNNLWKLKDVELIPPAKLPKKPILKLPKKSVPMLRGTNSKEECDDNASGETKNVIKSEVKPDDLKNIKSGDSLIVTGDENCTNTFNVPNIQNQDLLHSPSNVNPSFLTTTEITNVPEERDDSSVTDFELSPSKVLRKSTEVEDFQDASEPNLITDSVQNVNNLENYSIQDDNVNNSEAPFKDADVASREDPLDQDSFTDTSNINGVIVEPESRAEDSIDDQVDDDGASLNSSNNSDDATKIPKNLDPVSDTLLPKIIFKPIPSLSDTLSAIRENIKKLDFFINPTKTLTSEEINDDIAKYELEKKEKDSTHNSGSISENNDISNITDNDEEQPKSIEITDTSSDTVTLEDLQKLSNDLLDSSSNQEQKTSTPTEINNEQPESQPDVQDLQEERKTNSETIKNELSPIFTHVQNERNEEDIKINKCPNNIDLNSGQNNANSPQIKSTDRETELSERKDPSQMKSTDQETESSEMKTEASEPIISTLPNILDPLNLSEKLKLPFQNKIIQPSLPIDPLNLLNNPLDDIIDLNPKLPTLNKIVQPSLPIDPLNVLNNPLDDIIDLNPKLPTLDDITKQLSNVFSTNTDERTVQEPEEECDYDEEEIEKMAPGASTTNFQIKLPTVKSKENLDIFQLGSAKQSQRNSLGNNKKVSFNSYRAKVPVPKSLDLKPIKLESNGRTKDGVLRTPLKLNTDRRPTARTKLSNSKLPSKLNLLGDTPAMTLPTLDQLKDALNTSPNRLLGNSLQPNLNLFRSNPVSDFSDNIRLNAEKTMKSLQKKMRTSLRSPQISEPLAKPQEFLEDVSEKLNAIHYDLNDRLSSVHENILDTSKLQLPTTLLRAPDNLLNKNLMSNLRTTKPLRMETLASSISSREVNGPEIILIARKKENSQVKAKSPSKLFKNQDFAASAPTPVRLEKPTFGIDNDRFPLQRFNENTISPFDPKSKSSIPKPVFRKPNLKDSRVIITFGSTTPSSLRSVNIPVTRPPPRMDDIGFPKFKGNPIGSRFTTHSSSKPALDQTLMLSKTAQMPDKYTSILTPSENQQKENSLKLNKIPIPRTKINDANKFKSLSDAVKERLSSFDSFKHTKVPKLGSSNKPQVKIDNAQNKVTSNPDMIRSASENTDLVIRKEPLKENVSYKCKLVCTKE